MPRLGELLVATKLLTVEQVEMALRAQVMWGGRLGTNLIELGYLDLDTLAKALGKQHRVPPALTKHFDRVDKQLQKMLSPDVAERYEVVPLSRLPDQRIAVVAVAPLESKPRAIVADELGVLPAEVLVTVAAELRVRYHLERTYQIPRGARFLRAKGQSHPPFPKFEINEIEFEDSAVDIPIPSEQSTPIAVATVAPTTVTPPSPESTSPPASDATEPIELLDSSALTDLDDSDSDSEPAGTATDESAERAAEEAARANRRYVRTVTDKPTLDSERQLARIAIRRVAVVPATTGLTLGEATRAIRRGTDRDRVADLIIETIEQFVDDCRAALMLVVRGELAIGWKGYSGATPTLPEVGLPLDEPGLVPTAIQRGVTTRAAVDDLGAIDRLLLASTGITEGELVIVPVSIAGKVMCAIALVVPERADITAAESIAAAAGAAFARLIRNASR